MGIGMGMVTRMLSDFVLAVCSHLSCRCASCEKALGTCFLLFSCGVLVQVNGVSSLIDCLESIAVAELSHVLRIYFAPSLPKLIGLCCYISARLQSLYCSA